MTYYWAAGLSGSDVMGQYSMKPQETHFTPVNVVILSFSFFTSKWHDIIEICDS